MLSKRYESTEIDRGALLHVPLGTLLSTSRSPIGWDINAYEANIQDLTLRLLSCILLCKNEYFTFPF